MFSLSGSVTLEVNKNKRKEKRREKQLRIEGGKYR
jgi:hypothetical protein